MNFDDAFEDAEGFLGGVAGLFLAGRAHDGVPPNIRGGFAAAGLFGADETGGHVGDAVGAVEVEGVDLGRSGVPEEVVVLGGPAAFCARAVVVGPDDLVLEAGAAEDFVEQDLAVVDFAGVDVKEEAAGGGEDAVGFSQAGAQEAEIVSEAVGVACGCGCEAVGAVALAAEADAVAGGVADGAHPRPELPFAGVEGRVDVDEGDGGGGETAEDVEAVRLDDAVAGGLDRARRGVLGGALVERRGLAPGRDGFLVGLSSGYRAGPGVDVGVGAAGRLGRRVRRR